MKTKAVVSSQMRTALFRKLALQWTLHSEMAEITLQTCNQSPKDYNHVKLISSVLY